jgi:hypothetical protein
MVETMTKEFDSLTRGEQILLNKKKFLRKTAKETLERIRSE